MAFLYIKAFHIIFVLSWFAGLFYLPRIFVNLAMVPKESILEKQRLLLMARKLFRFTTILAIPAIVLGAVLLHVYGVGEGEKWMDVKLIAVLLAVLFHASTFHFLRIFERNEESHGHVWFRWYNEIPLLFFVLAVIMVVVKPF